MIRYTLKCADGHAFDSWFQSASAYDVLAGRGHISCTVCGSVDVSKALMAPRVAAPAASISAPADTGAATAHGPGDAVRKKSLPPPEHILRALRAHVTATSTHVGPRFASEARAMHLGDVAQRPIHGEASGAEVKSLLEDGIPVLPMPADPKGRAN